MVIKIVDRDDDNWAAGHISVALTDLLASEDGKVEWWSLSGCPNGQLRLSTAWNPIKLK
jgi:Ca2+-dependent lipid-binding protein